jgi:hypothetical protein
MTATDLKEALRDLGNSPNPFDLANFVKIAGNSGVWLSRSALRYLVSQVNFSINLSDYSPDSRAKIILEAVSNGNPLDSEKYSEQEVFQTLFNDLEYAHHNHLYQTPLRLPETNITIGLISGVFNELFSTPAFSRGADHLKKEAGLKSFFLKASGSKGIPHNSKLIKKQLDKFTAKNPEAKIWLVAFSKGGVDALHFMHENPKFCEKHIMGISTMATPIMGTRHLEKPVIKGLSAIEKLQNRYSFLDKDFQKSLSYDYQGMWFKEHFKELPSCFYTAVGFESQWYQSHLWMVLTKALLQSSEQNDGVVDIGSSQFPDYFHAHNFGILRGHHLIGTRSSFFSQEALLEAHLIYLNYKGLI